MKRNIQAISLDLIKLDQENVRFGGDIAQNQREAIDLIMADPDEAKKLLRLANHIAEHGLDPTELQLVTPDQDGSYIVLEGNRRLTALKLLQRPDLCPDEKMVKSFMAAHNRLNGNLPTEIDCSVVSSRSAGDMWIELKHTGQNGGIGRVNWDSDIRDERRARQTGIESIGRQIRNLVKDNSDIFSSDTVRDIFAIHVTTLTRLFSSTPAQDAFQIKIENRELIPLLPLAYIAPSVEFAINLFKNEGYNVNDIRSDEDRRRFVGHIPPELHPLKIKSLAESNHQTKTVDDSTPPSSGCEPGDVGGHQPTGSHVTDLGNGPDTTPGKTNGTGTNEPGKRPRAKPSSRARKYLLPWSLNIKNSRINEIYRELRSVLEVDRSPNATAIAFRVFIEVSCDAYIQQQERNGTPIIREDNQKPVTGDSTLSVKIKSVVSSLEGQKKITNAESKAISKRASTKDTIGSVDHFNQFVHSSASAPIPSELKDIADEYKPMLEAIWQ
ncbi:TPA: hypothetical protein ACSP17_001944 [Aeromonas hydrophila]